MSEQRLLDELDALDNSPWWMAHLPKDGPAWPPPFPDAPAYGVADADGPVNAATIHIRLDAVQARKRRMTMHALIGFALVLVFVAAFTFDVEPVLASDAIYFLGGAAGAALLVAPSFVAGYAREEKRLTLYRLLAAPYDGHA